MEGVRKETPVNQAWGSSERWDVESRWRRWPWGEGILRRAVLRWQVNQSISWEGWKGGLSPGHTPDSAWLADSAQSRLIVKNDLQEYWWWSLGWFTWHDSKDLPARQGYLGLIPLKLGRSFLKGNAYSFQYSVAGEQLLSIWDWRSLAGYGSGSAVGHDWVTQHLPLNRAAWENGGRKWRWCFRDNCWGAKSMRQKKSCVRNIGTRFFLMEGRMQRFGMQVKWSAETKILII